MEETKEPNGEDIEEEEDLPHKFGYKDHKEGKRSNHQDIVEKSHLTP